MMVTMCAFLVIGGYALSTLTGILSSDAVMALRENKIMEHSLDRLANHVIVIGFGGRGEQPARRAAPSRGRIGGGDHGRSDRRCARRSARQRDKSLMAAVDPCAQRREAEVRALTPDRRAAEAGCRCG